MRLTILTILLLSSPLCLAQLSTDPLADATDAVEAALVVAQVKSGWNELRKDCAQANPARKQGYARLYVRWQSDNRAEILGMLALAARDPQVRSQTEALNRMPPGADLTLMSKRLVMKPAEACDTQFVKLAEHGYDLAKTFPKASKLMKDYGAKQPLSSRAARAYDSPMGCVTAALNGKYDYEAALPLCDCNWKAMSGTMSDAEFDEYEKLVVAGDSTAARALPQIQRTMPKLVACREKFPVKKAE